MKDYYTSGIQSSRSLKISYKSIMKFQQDALKIWHLAYWIGGGVVDNTLDFWDTDYTSRKTFF